MEPKDRGNILAVIEEQKQGFRAGLLRRTSDIRDALEAIEPGAEASAFGPLHRMVHNVAGAGGTFGFQILSELARPISNMLRKRSEVQGAQLIRADELRQLSKTLKPLLMAMERIAAD